jgi:ADP-ribose pyrophosphatase
MESFMKFDLIQSEIVYKGHKFVLRSDRVRTPDSIVDLDIVEHNGSVVLVPVDEEKGQVYFVRQYRHAAGQEILELPAGTLEVGEAPEACAAREIREETGMAAATLKEIGAFYLAPGYSTEYMHVFLATGLTHDPLEADADEFLSVETLPLAEALKLAESGQLPDAKSLAALLLARRYLQ